MERYRRIAKIGSGVATTVYLAIDEKLHRKVVEKVVGQEHRDALIREYETLRAISPHPNVVEPYELVERGNEAFIVMEFVGEQTLKDLAPTLSFEDALRALTNVAGTLRDLHNRGFLYCDLKPQNLVIADRETLDIKFVDFELATRLTDDKTETVPGWYGTPEFMSPEQAWGGVLGKPADVYGFGMLAYELWSGRQPFAGMPASAICIRQRALDVPDLADIASVPAGANELVRICLSKEPQERFPCFEEVLEALSEITTPPGWWQRFVRWWGG